MKCNKQVLTFTLQTPIGQMVVSHCQNGLHEVTQTRSLDDTTFDPQTGSDVTIEEGSLPYEHAQACFDWLSTYFADPKNINNAAFPQICNLNSNGSFAEKVCLTLAKNVRFGQTVSYKQLAEMVGNPGAARSVGGAMAHNPLHLLVPCHRVLPTPRGATNLCKVGKYIGGSCVKQWLLHHEGQQFIGDKMVKN